MSDALHRLKPDAGNLGRRRLGQFHGAGIVVFTRQHKKPALGGFDAPDTFPSIPLAGIEGDVAEEDLRAALAVVPRDLFHVFGRALRRAESAYPLRHELRLVDVRVRRPNRLALVDLVASLAGDDASEGLGVPIGQSRQISPDIDAPSATGFSSPAAAMKAMMRETYRSVFSRQEPWIAPSGGGDLPCQGRSNDTSR